MKNLRTIALVVLGILTVLIGYVAMFPKHSPVRFGDTGGPNYPGTAANHANGFASSNWVNPNNIKVADNVYATFTDNGSGDPSQDLQGTNYGFSIPSTATINGIQVTIGELDSSNSANTFSLKLIKGGVISGTDHSSVTSWPTTNTPVTYGGTSDLWGLALTPTDINNSSFGVNLVAATNGGTGANVDYIRITVTYTPAASSQHVTVTHTAGTLTITQGTVIIP